MKLIVVFLQASGGGGLPFWVMMIGMFAVIYFFMILPNQRKQKKQESFRQAINKGDDIVTIGGIHGKVHAVEDDTIVLLIDKSTKLIIDKSAISMEASQRYQNTTESS